MDLQNISCSMYMGLCRKLGTQEEVASRRKMDELVEHFTSSPSLDWTLMKSGSRREGFDFPGSDVDIMCCINFARVLWDIDHSKFYNKDHRTLILCDNSECSPGFTLLWLPFENPKSHSIPGCVKINGALYISSAKLWEYFKNEQLFGIRKHGPCFTSTLVDCEIDLAFCLTSDFLPPVAFTWIDRCHSWPPRCVADDITRNGCHFVAIGNKAGNHNYNEWRISFSEAEMKLVSAMNHTQFLTYGLLKVFLKEIINNGLNEEEKLLCSYHVKTTIFWAIQQNTSHEWSPHNLLPGFWICFKLLLKWVYEGVCPNFFIPENNMFLSKVYGEAQLNLFQRLYALYEKGIKFLLQSPSLRPYIVDVLCNPTLSVSLEEDGLISKNVLGVACFDYLCKGGICYGSLPRCWLTDLRKAEHLILSPLTQYEIVALQMITASVLKNTAHAILNIFTKASTGNKGMYTGKKITSNMLKLSAKFGASSHVLFFILHCYKTGRYRKALSVIERTGLSLKSNYILPNQELPISLFEGKSLSEVLKKYFQTICVYGLTDSCIDELSLEMQCIHYGLPGLFMPALVLILMVEF